MIKMIAFDLDGTIGDTIPMCLQAFEEAVSPHAGHRLSETEIVQTFGLNETGMIRQIVHDRWKEALRDFLTAYRRLHDQCPCPFDGILELLDTLHARGIRLALVTGKGKESCRITLEQFKMSGLFCTIKTGSDKYSSKAPAIVDLMRQFRLRPDNFLYIGDTVSDISACREAGVDCLSAAWGTTADIPALEAANPSRVFRSVRELCNYLTKNINLPSIPRHPQFNNSPGKSISCRKNPSNYRIKSDEIRPRS